MKRKHDDTLGDLLQSQIRENPLRYFKQTFKTNKMDILEFILLERLVDPSIMNNWAIRYASLHGHKKVVKLLLNHPRVDPSAINNCAIKRASENGHKKVVRLLLNDPRVDPSAVENWAIRWASRNGHEDVVTLLLNHPRVDPSACDNYAIIYASRNGNEEIIRLLLNHPRVDPSPNNNYAIRLASRKGHEEVVKHLLGHSCKLQNRTRIAPNILQIIDTWDCRPDTIVYFSKQIRSELFVFLLCVKRRQWYYIVKNLRFLIGTYLLDRRTPTQKSIIV